MVDARAAENGAASSEALRHQPDPRPFNLLEHPLRQTKIRLVRTAVGVAEDRRYLEAAREVVGGGGVIAGRLDVVAVAEVERELDPRVGLRLVELREVVVAAPVVGEERAGVAGVGGVHAEGVEAVAVEVEGELVRELDRHGRFVVAASRSLQAEVVDPGGVLEGLVDRAVAVDEPWGADAVGCGVPAVDRSRGFGGAAGDGGMRRAAGGAVPDDEFLFGHVGEPLAAFERIRFDVHVRSLSISGGARARAPPVKLRGWSGAADVHSCSTRSFPALNCAVISPPTPDSASSA